MTVASLKAKLEAHHYSAKTLVAYVSWIQALIKHTENKQPSKISRADVESFFGRLQQRGYKTESIRQAGAAIRFYYKEVTAKPDNLLAIPRIKHRRTLGYIPSQAEIFRVIEAIEEPELKTLFMVIYGCGLELSEALDLKVSNFKSNSQILSFTNQRGKKRTVVVPIVVRAEVQKLTGHRKPTGVVFRYNGEAINKSKCHRSLAKAKERSGCNQNFDTRGLRHAYVKHLEDYGYSFADIFHNLNLSSWLVIDYYASYTPRIEILASPADLEIDTKTANSGLFPYVSSQRLEQIKSLKNEDFDYTRINLILEELNLAAQHGNLHTIALLIRLFIDHSSPLLGQPTFTAAANSFSGSKSLKKNLILLDTNLRNIADLFLHEAIRARETAPTPQQVDFRSQFDQLLGEIYRRHK